MRLRPAGAAEQSLPALRQLSLDGHIPTAADHSFRQKRPDVEFCNWSPDTVSE